MVCNMEFLHIENSIIYIDHEYDTPEFREFLKENGIEVESEKDMICG